MRKVKLLALLLAALMVVTAFAGCAGDTTEIEGEVDGLESRVEALESAIGNVQGGVSDLESSVSGIGSSIDANNTTIQGVLDALKDLESQLNEKPTETQAPATETQAPVAGDAVEALKKRADELGALIGGLQAEVMAAQTHYIAAEYVAALQALTAAHTEIAASNTVAAMDAVYAALEAKLAALVRVDEKFYNYYIELKGNYTGDEACLEKVEEALEWFKEAEEHYKNTTLAYVEDKADPTKTILGWTNYKTDEVDKKGEPVYAKLADCKAEMEGWETALENVKKQAKTFVATIDGLKADAQYADLATLVGQIATWKKSAVALAPVHGDLVTNYAKLEAALSAALNFTVAKTLLQALKVESVFDGASVNLFADYNSLANKTVFVAVNADGTFKLDKNKDVVYTADIFANIDKAIEKWIDENDITEEVAEFIINQVFATDATTQKTDDYFYAKYLNTKEFVASMAAEFETFKKDIAPDFFALNSKTLSDATALVTGFEANAKEIDAWFKASSKAYTAACNAADKADKTLRHSRVVAAGTAYDAALAANFNEMVVLAGLGTYDEDAKEYYFGTKTNYNYSLGFNTTSNVNYIQFYNFKDDSAATFLTTTFMAAKTAAETINNTVANFPVLQQISVKEVLTAIGGYHKFGYLDLDLDAATGVDGKETPAIIVVEDKKYEAGTIADYMAKYGKDGTVSGKADLSSLVDMAAYNKLVADVFARIDEIDAATVKLNAAYEKLLGLGDEAIITTANTADVAELVAAISAWKNAGGRSDAQLAVEYKTVGDYKTYTLASVIADCEALSQNTDFEEVVKKLQDRAAAIVAEMNMLVSLYQMLDKVNGFTTITIDSLSKTASSSVSVKGANIAITAVTQRTANSDGEYDYDASYITFDGTNYKFKVATAYKIYNDEAKQALSEAQKQAYTAVAGKGFASDLSVNKTLDEMSAAWNKKAFKITDLIKIATGLYDKFMVDNYGIKVDSVENAKKSFDAANNGYQLKGWIVDTINTVKAQDVGFDVSSLKTVTTLAGLTTTLNAATHKVASTISYGGYTVASMTADFKLAGDTTYADLGIDDATDYDVPAYVVFEVKPAPAV